MYSLNVPLPREVHEQVASLRPALAGFDDIREGRSQTLVVKRLDAEDRREYLDAERQAMAALRGAPSFEVAIDGIGTFQNPPHGRGPVVYLAIESPGLRAVHNQLVEALGAISDLEGPEYTPHVTLARGGDERAIEQLRSVDIDPITWTADSLQFYDATYRERIDTVSLPA